MLIYTAWVAREKPAVAVGAFVCVMNFPLAYAVLRWYDIPVRNWLQRRLLA
jgi:hypothetical protein